MARRSKAAVEPEVVESAQAPVPWRNRIVGHGNESPDQLLAHPFNWRVHSIGQQEFAEEIISRLGWISEVKVNRVTGHVIDGHMRIMLAMRRGEPTVPVEYVELTPEEEALALATYDPLSALASRDEDRLRALIASGVQVDPAAQALLDRLHGEARSPRRGLDGSGEFPVVDENIPTDRCCPRCGYAWSEGRP